MVDKISEIRYLITKLNDASNAYYNTGHPIMTDKEFDRQLKELQIMEQETGVIFSDSPTQNVGATVLGQLNVVQHGYRPMLSLDKVHSAEEIIKFARGQNLIASIKLDGLSVRLIYQDGKLVQAVTRGNGIEGNDITEHVKQFLNVPLTIRKTGLYIPDGEAIITNYDFHAINAALPEGVEKYKNARNLASGTLNSLDTIVTKQRKVRFILWDVIEGDDAAFYSRRLYNASRLGFECVKYAPVPSEFINGTKDIDGMNNYMLQKAKELAYPCDGVVWKFDDITFGDSLGRTIHHFCNGVAYKFEDDKYETTLHNIEWSMGKTGALCPVAVFEPVEIEGTEVSRASVHNVSILSKLDLQPGDTITIYKANQIIPQVAENLSIAEHGNKRLELPGTCPVCGGLTEVRTVDDVSVLMCMNENCKGKLLGKLKNAVSKNALNIKGLSEAILEFLIDEGWVSSLKDLFHLNEHEAELKKYPGWGKKSVENLLTQLTIKKETTLERLLYAQNIPLIGQSVSKDIAAYCKGSLDTFCNIMVEYEAKKFLSIDGFGDAMLTSLMNWFDNHWVEFLELKQEFSIVSNESEKLPNKDNAKSLNGKTFCITGKLEVFKNRDALISDIEEHGGKYVGSVSKNTDYLINNDTESSSNKNVKAKQVGCKIISEQDYLKMIKEQ